MARPLIALAGLLSLAALLVGCGGSDGGATESTSSAFARESANRQHRISVLKAKLALEKERQALRKEREAAAVPPASSSPTSKELSGFSELEAELPGEVGVAIGPPGGGTASTAGSLQTGSAWSTSKVPVSLAVLHEVGGPSGLSSTQADEMRRALTLSDNEAALALFADLEATHGGPAGAASAVDEVLREAGDDTTQVSSVGRDGFTPFGQTEWALPLQELFMSRLASGCVGSRESDEYVLGLMGEVSSDTWGLGSAGLPARWKGGWGPGTDGRYLVRQMGILSVGEKEAIVTLAALPEDGQFATGQSMATSLAQWLAKNASGFAGQPGHC